LCEELFQVPFTHFLNATTMNSGEKLDKVRIVEWKREQRQVKKSGHISDP